MKMRDLERILQGLQAVPTPRAEIEQYPTPPGIAAEVAYIGLGKGDLAGRTVLDIGCGNGVLAIAAALLGASAIVGVDVDPEAIEVARRNGRKAGANVDWRVADVRTLSETVDTVLMNPPFGSQQKHADLPFLDRGLELAQVVYSFHNAKTKRFVERRIAARGARITDSLEYAFPLARTFSFHREEERRVPVLLFRIAAKG